MLTTVVPTLPMIAEALPHVESNIRELVTSSTLSRVNDASRRVTASGKRLRSIVILTGTLALGGALDKRAITSAACVEVLHAGSLVHDDLMDNATERRGVPTINADWGVGPALLVGDLMLAKAGQAALRDISAEAAGHIAAAVADLVEGQFMEVLDLHDRGRTADRALKSIELKTATLFRLGCVLANHCAGTGEERRMAEYGTAFGLLFQLVDDVLDLEEDQREGVYSYPFIEGTDRTLELCHDLARQAADAVPDHDNEAVALLRDLPGAYLDWAIASVA
ncbi:hypothetical protein Lesp02_80540 [Lentzea sp. NBRC 105346]|uniref:polyprenyl synthetase family protein n=1 Tax=Lentzea sp. NBRC 105346 TaxID=3032205 RepID=UPI0024A124D9|nr:polyprenyl synthetase family protein [Lentzea sp. NBRC 105346]GLZ35867.1 hypothetical protein Lesp02_80540 [Lentzea sp. NBRC 105346]